MYKTIDKVEDFQGEQKKDNDGRDNHYLFAGRYGFIQAGKRSNDIQDTKDLLFLRMTLETNCLILNRVEKLNKPSAFKILEDPVDKNG
jgi:hypothetical protein